jgi:large subunit ribosomal protein L21
MYAIVNIAGVQMRAAPEEILDIPLLDALPGAEVTFDQVLMLSDGDQITVGQPVVANASIAVVVLEHLRGPKIIIGKYKRRKDYRLRKGHRQDFTRVRVTGITR